MQRAEVGERNEIVRSVSDGEHERDENRTANERTANLRGYGVGFERWTDEASAAERALRLRVATAVGYRPAQTAVSAGCSRGSVLGNVP